MHPAGAERHRIIASLMGSVQPSPSSPPPASDASIDSFLDALWLEDGLSPNTLAAYRRDLALYAQWLHGAHGLKLPQTEEHHL